MPPVTLEKLASTAVITLNHPQRLNALDDAMRDGLRDAINQVAADREIKAVVLTGAGGNFSAGGDIRHMAQTNSAKNMAFQSRQRMQTLHHWLVDLIRLEKPLIAAVEGNAFGGGLSLALACDYVFSAPDARYCSVFSKIGFVPDMGAMYLLPRIVGLKAAKQLAFSAKVFGAQEAQTLGIVDEIHASQLLQKALAFANRFANAPSEAIGLAKLILNQSFESSLEQVFQQEAIGQTLCRETDFHKEAIRRFMAKEPALFSWENTF